MKSIQWRITLPLMTLIFVITGITGAYLVNFVRNSQTDGIRSHLEDEARIAAEASSPLLNQGNALDVLAKKLGQEIDARITIIAPDGKVLGDSQEDPAVMENHANRPEVIDALAFGCGESIRFSATLNTQMMYVAVPILNGGNIAGVARASLPLTAVEESVNYLTMVIILAMMILAILTILAAGVIARQTTRPIRQLTKAAYQITAGQLGNKIPVRTVDEVGRLGNAFNEMSANLKSLVDTLSAEKARLSGVLSNMADGVIVIDADGIVLLVNQAAEKLFKFQEQNALNKPIIELVRDYEVSEIIKSCRITSKAQSVRFEPGITKKFIQIIAIPLTGSQPGKVLLLFQDLTDLRNLQTMRREMIGNISHDFRTPIAGIKAMVETLQDGAIEDREVAKDFLSRIENEVDKLTLMVAELTELSRIESGEVNLDKQLINLNTVAGEIVAEMKPLADRQEIILSSVLAPDLPLINVDKTRIEQAIINLVHNAIKFNHPGGTITIATRFDRDAVTVSVSDNGVGIAREDLPHIFERFFKVEKARTAGGGSGLGLAIAKHIAQAHNGTIQVQSEEGKGSTFTISLPR